MAGMGIRRLGFTVLSVVALVGAASVTGQNAAAAPDPSGGSGLEVYVGNVTPGGVEEMRQLGVDPTTAAGDPGPAGTVEVEAVLSEAQVAKLRKAGVRLNVKKVDGVAASEALRRQAVQGWDAFRPYSGPAASATSWWRLLPHTGASPSWSTSAPASTASRSSR